MQSRIVFHRYQIRSLLSGTTIIKTHYCRKFCIDAPIQRVIAVILKPEKVIIQIRVKFADIIFCRLVYILKHLLRQRVVGFRAGRQSDHK